MAYIVVVDEYLRETGRCFIGHYVIRLHPCHRHMATATLIPSAGKLQQDHQQFVVDNPPRFSITPVFGLVD